MIIGLTGSYAAGKDTVANYLVKKGFAFHSLSDILRQELNTQNKPITRENLIELGNQIRNQHGPGELARRTVEQIQTKNEQNSIVVSIRNPEEVRVLKQNSSFQLWYVDAPQRLRYDRTVARGRSDDFSSFDEFVRLEQKENSTDPNDQQLQKVAEMADHEIINDKDFKILYKDIEELLELPQHESRD